MAKIIPSTDLDDGSSDKLVENNPSAIPVLIKVAGYIYFASVISNFVINYIQFGDEILSVLGSGFGQYIIPWIIGIIIGYALCILLGVFILKGKSWPRLVVLLGSIVSWTIFYSYFNKPFYPDYFRYTMIVISIGCAAILFILYSKSVNAWYKQKKLTFFSDRFK